MEQVRCTNCGSTAIITDDTRDFCICESCGSTFNVGKAAAFSKVTLDHTQDIRAWREYLNKQLKLQLESSKARDYGGVKLFAQKILSVLTDDFCASFYVALADRFDSDNDVAFVDFLLHADVSSATPAELKEVTECMINTVEPKYVDTVKAFLLRAYGEKATAFDQVIDRNIKSYIQKLRYTKVSERDVFICHRTAAPDQDIADAICTRLEERGLRCWIAPRNILAGSQNYERDIVKGVENCRLFLLVSSFKSIYSEDCEMELKAAVLADKALYSYRIDDTPYDGAFEKALSSVQWLDAADDPYAHLEQLVIDIKGLLAQDEREKEILAEKRFEAREKERKELEDARAREKERIERLEKIVSGGVAATIDKPTSRSKLKRAEIELQAGNFDRAERIIDETLDIDPENPLAWWLMMLCDMHVKSDAALVESGRDYTVNRYYHSAERFAHLDPTFERRFENMNASFNNRAIVTANDCLSRADGFLRSEDFDSLNLELEKCKKTFGNEDSLVFKKFPDVASRFFWLKLWAKYGQTKLVCVEDITREAEYKLAIKYASPTQALEYDAARETVSRNAQLFLRERAKNPDNDGKLVDYLVDNKNILPPDTYNYYSSLLYFRKMLSQLKMTREKLDKSTTDITTNEYFMLAQSLATDEQKAEYDALVDRIERNRAEKEKKAREDREAAAAAKAKQEKSAKTKNIVGNIVCGVSIGLSVLFGILAIVFLATYFGGGYSMLLAGIIARLINDVTVLVMSRKKWLPFPIINLVVNIISFGVALIMGMSMGRVLPFMIPAVVLEIVSINRCKKKL